MAHECQQFLFLVVLDELNALPHNTSSVCIVGTHLETPQLRTHCVHGMHGKWPGGTTSERPERDVVKALTLHTHTRCAEGGCSGWDDPCQWAHLPGGHALLKAAPKQHAAPAARGSYYCNDACNKPAHQQQAVAHIRIRYRGCVMVAMEFKVTNGESTVQLLQQHCCVDVRTYVQ